MGGWGVGGGGGAHRDPVDSVMSEGGHTCTCTHLSITGASFITHLSSVQLLDVNVSVPVIQVVWCWGLSLGFESGVGV